MEDSVEDSVEDMEETDLTPPNLKMEDGDFVYVFQESARTEDQRFGVQFLLLVMFTSVRQTSQFMLPQST